MFGTKSGASDFEYKLNEINIANVWNPNETEPDKKSIDLSNTFQM